MCVNKQSPAKSPTESEGEARAAYIVGGAKATRSRYTVLENDAVDERTTQADDGWRRERSFDISFYVHF